MKTLRVPSDASRKPTRTSVQPATGIIHRSSKLITCGTSRQLSRAEIMAEDAAFLDRMSAGVKGSQSSVELVREGR